MEFLTYKGWKIQVFRQIRLPPFLDYYGLATKVVGNRILMMNAEGNNEKEALNNIKGKVDEKTR